MSKPKPPEHEKGSNVSSLLDRLPPGRRARQIAMLTFREHITDRLALGRLGDWAAKLDGVDLEKRLAELARWRNQSDADVVLTRVNLLSVGAAKRLMSGDEEGAFAAWAAVVEEYPQHCAEALELRALFRTTRGELDEALADLTRSTELAPTVARAYALRGSVYQAMDRVEEALANYRRALQLDPDDVDALAGMARCFDDAGEHERAIRFLTRAIKRAPKKARLRAERAYALEALGREDEALADFDAAIALEPEVAEFHQGRGRCLPAERRAEALAELTRAIELDPDDAGYWTSRSFARFDAGALDDALADAERAIELDPRLATALMARGRVHEARGDLPRALADYEEAGRLDPDEILHVMARAGVHQALGDAHALRADVEAAAALDPESVELRALHGRLLLQEGAFARALEDFEAAFALGLDELTDARKAQLHHDAAAALSGLGRTEEAARHEALAAEIARG
jgi:tetratricopeptide (TPR) repeat protein